MAMSAIPSEENMDLRRDVLKTAGLPMCLYYEHSRFDPKRDPTSTGGVGTGPFTQFGRALNESSLLNRRTAVGL